MRYHCRLVRLNYSYKTHGRMCKYQSPMTMYSTLEEAELKGALQLFFGLEMMLILEGNKLG